MSTVALIIIYNHQYNNNIPKLEKIYQGRFSHIYHLVPFYSGDLPNVIPVYDCSYYFQGYVAQGFKSFFKIDYDHYFFIGDDLILNPIINEFSYKQHLKLLSSSCFIPRLSTLDESQQYWPVNREGFSYNATTPGVEAKNQLPSVQEAEDLLRKFNLVSKSLNFHQIWQVPSSQKEWFQKIRKDRLFLLRFMKSKALKKSYIPSYPLVRSYSDIFVLSSKNIEKFCHYCGVFSATRLFVELAIPTALVFTADAIVTEKDISLKGRALWTKEDHGFLEKYNNNLKHLLEDFPQSSLYIHPIKLSKWVS